MRLAMVKYYRAFIWEQHNGGQAYNWTIKSLFRCVKVTLPHLATLIATLSQLVVTLSGCPCMPHLGLSRATRSRHKSLYYLSVVTRLL